MTFQFNAYGNVLSVTPNDITAELAKTPGVIEDGMTALSTAYVIANRNLLWNNADSKDGIWHARSKNEFTWVEGNFFD